MAGADDREARVSLLTAQLPPPAPAVPQGWAGGPWRQGRGVGRPLFQRLSEVNATIQQGKLQDGQVLCNQAPYPRAVKMECKRRTERERERTFQSVRLKKKKKTDHCGSGCGRDLPGERMPFLPRLLTLPVKKFN